MTITPVNFVNWYSAIRFANWLNNGQANGDTETGSYTLGPLGPGGVPINGASITRNEGATVFIPTENEWYKAAYYDPSTHSYFEYASSSNTPPTASLPTGAINSANYFNIVHDLTDVGAYSGTTSPYGVFDMVGNVLQWNDTLISESRSMRGSGFDNYNPEAPHSSNRNLSNPKSDSYSVGFRVATVPEPSTVTLAAFGIISLVALGWRRRKFRLVAR